MSAMILPDVRMMDYVTDSVFVPGMDGDVTLSSSIAHRLLTRSALHAWTAHPRLNPGWEPDNNRDFDLGTAAHSALLEGKPLHVVQIVDEKTGELISPTDYKKKATQTARDAAKAAGETPVLAHVASDISCMVTVARATLRDCPDLEGLGELVAEQTILWEESGAWLRCRPDWITADHRIVLSVKTTRASAEPDAFLRTILNMGYDVQSAFELAGVRAATGVEPTHYIWLVVEAEAPFACSLVGLSPMLRDLGERKLARAVALWTHCLTTDTWPGYGEHVVYVDPPEWAVSQWVGRHMYAPAEDDGGPLVDQLMGRP